MRDLHYMIFKAPLGQALQPWEKAGRGGMTMQKEPPMDRL